MLDKLFPDGVILVVAEGEMAVPPLYPEEEAAIAQAVEKRRREFTIGRACAREALHRLGEKPGPIPMRADRAPIWPEHIVGCITHCTGFIAAAVSHKRDFNGIGLDAEPAEPPLKANLIRLICTDAERARIEHPAGNDWPKLLFCAKEAVYKAVAPMSGVRLGFQDVELDFEDDEKRFSARLVRAPDDRLPAFDRLSGRYIIRGGLIVTSVTLATNGPVE